MKTHKWSDVAKKKLGEKRYEQIRAEVRREILEANLRELRNLAGKTQVEVAQATEMAQSEVSKLENRQDFLLSTLRRYVEALGGELEVIARFDDKTVRLRGV